MSIKFVIDKRNWSYIGEDILLCSVCNRPENLDKWTALMESRRKVPSRPLGEGIGVHTVNPVMPKKAAPRPQFRATKKR